MLHFSSPYPADERLWIVEPRLPAGPGTTPFRGARAGDRLALPGGASIDLRAPYLGEPRLWVARPRLVGSVERYLGRHGGPIRYGYAAGDWDMDAYQTVFAIEPGSAEMPSAGRPFTSRRSSRAGGTGVRSCRSSSTRRLVARGRREPVARAVRGLAGLGRAPERGPWGRRPGHRDRDDRRPRARVGRRRRRACARRFGLDGRRDQPDRGVAAVDGLLTGWHEPGASHLG